MGDGFGHEMPAEILGYLRYRADTRLERSVIIVLH